MDPWRRSVLLTGRQMSCIRDVLVANLGMLGVGGALCHEVGCDAGAYFVVTKVLADPLTRGGQQALRRCRSHSPSGHQPEPADLFPDGR